MAMASASAASSLAGSALGRSTRTIAWIWRFSAWPAPTTVFFTRFAAYSATGSPASAGTNSAMPRACPSLRVACASLLTKVSSTATSCGESSRSTAASPSWSCLRRSARLALSFESTVPQATNASRVPSIVTSPQPVRRRPGSMPRMRVGNVAKALPLSSPGLTRRSRSSRLSLPGRDGRVKPGHDKAWGRSSPRPRHRRLRDLEVHEDVLHVVVVLERLDEADQFFRRLVVDIDRILGAPDEGGFLRFAEAGLERLRDLGERTLLAIDLVPVLARGDVVGAGLDRRLEHGVGVGRLGVELDHAHPVEQEGDRAGLGEVAAALREHGADAGGGAVAVVGHRLDNEGRAARTVALVADLLIGLGVAALRLLDRTVDVVLRHVLGLGGEDRGAEAWVEGRIGGAELRRDGDLAGELAEELGALRVHLALLVHDVLELGMSGHAGRASRERRAGGPSTRSVAIGNAGLIRRRGFLLKCALRMRHRPRGPFGPSCCGGRSRGRGTRRLDPNFIRE